MCAAAAVVFAGVLRGQVMLQALPCIVAAQVLDPAPGSQVLDMCAAPGGKRRHA
jgi:16S rRNA C967 or C1407 C5-methylase (RsmB/RsmF family)